MNKNPFDVLGIAPSAIRGMNDDQIVVFIKGVARELLKIYHPDKSKGTRAEKRTVEINIAMEQLDRSKYPEAFEQWKKSFLKKTPMTKKLDDAYHAVRVFEKNFQELSGSLADVLANHFSAASDHIGQEVLEITVHNPWLIQKTFRWVATGKASSAAFFRFSVDANGFVLCRDDEKIGHRKQIIGSIDENAYLNVVSPKIKKVFDDIQKRSQIAAHNAARTGKTKYHGPAINREHFHLLAKYIRFGEYQNGYIVTINESTAESYFQIEGSVKKRLSQQKASLA